MQKIPILVFDEAPPEGFLGMETLRGAAGSERGNRGNGGGNRQGESAGSSLLSELPIWVNFRVKDLLSRFYPHRTAATLLPFRTRGSTDGLITFLKKEETAERIVVGRTGNLTLLDWKKLLGAVRGSRSLLKLQVGKTPSDLYVVGKKELLLAADSWETDRPDAACDFLSWLFDRYLFHNFEKIQKIDGFSLLLRNSYEYHTENIRIAGSLGSKGYCGLYRQLASDTLAGTTVTETGEVFKSVLGAGVKVSGAVVGSVLFSGVTVERHALVKNSVVLPQNTVGMGTTLENTLVLEGNRRIIGKGSVIGGGRETENPRYRDILKHGLTVIGTGVGIPPGSRIGAGCLVAGAGGEYETAIELDDGCVFIN
ncbi:MAG: hypothetical protein JXQ30_13480 [Spirochaetes bacterium]|nr:hypothetical protein [Spirochaetota bacterium]